METRTYTEKSNARRAARAAGVDPNLVFATEDGFAFPHPNGNDVDPETSARLMRDQQAEAEANGTPDLTDGGRGSYSRFPDQNFDRNGERRVTEKTPLKEAIDLAVERGISPKEFRAIAESMADDLDSGKMKDDDDIPASCKMSQEERKDAWERNQPKPAPIKETTMAKAKTTKRSKESKSAGKSGADKTATLLSMLKGKGSTVDAMTKALGWLPHTLRARISRLPKDDKKIKIERTRVDGVTSYRTVS